MCTPNFTTPHPPPFSRPMVLMTRRLHSEFQYRLEDLSLDDDIAINDRRESPAPAPPPHGTVKGYGVGHRPEETKATTSFPSAQN